TAGTNADARGYWLLAGMESDRNGIGRVSALAPELAPRDAVFASFTGSRISDRDLMQTASPDSIFAGPKPREEGDTRLDVPLFPDPNQGLPEDRAQPNPSGRPNDDLLLDYIHSGSDLLGD